MTLQERENDSLALDASALGGDGGEGAQSSDSGQLFRAASANQDSAPRELDGIVHILTCGSVDDGKSTLIGRLLWDATDLPEDTRASLVGSAVGGEPDLSLLVDGLVAEREQGITIDIAWRYVDSGPCRLVIIDSPGHEQYTRNMASGASHADVAVLLIDARHGVKRQTLRHAAILDLVGVRHVILAVNKMDLVAWSEACFERIEADFRALARRFRFTSTSAVPVAAKPGDNVVHRSSRMPWYVGPTLVELLARSPSRRTAAAQRFRFPVQSVFRAGDDFRGLAGTVTSGRLEVGTLLKEVATGRQARVSRIVTMAGDRAQASSGEAVVIQLDSDLDVARGALLIEPNDCLRPVRRLDARLVWLADEPLDIGRGLLLRTATDLVPVTALAVRARLDLETLTEQPGAACAANDIALTEISLARATALDRFEEHHETGCFILVDALSGATLAGGIVEALPEPDGSVPSAAFRLTGDLLASGICAGLDRRSSEFRRRAEEVALILAAAGVAVDLVDAYGGELE
jgi:bifunctional enzyme CysN/CysC